MEYISAEKFLKPSKKIQLILTNYANLNITDYDLVQMNGKIVFYVEFKNRDEELLNCDSFPLFTESLLRRVIEDMTNSKVEIMYLKDGYSIRLSKNNPENTNKIYFKLGEDLLQAYWKVALEIVKEELSNEFK
jgi:hypothetical protein